MSAADRVESSGERSRVPITVADVGRVAVEDVRPTRDLSVEVAAQYAAMTAREPKVVPRGVQEAFGPLVDLAMYE